MSDSSISIVPRVSVVPNRIEKAKNILTWLQQSRIIDKEKTNCNLGKGLGYSVAEGAAFVVKEEQFLPFRLQSRGLEVISEKRIFTTFQNGLNRLICPTCGDNIVTHNWDFFEEWYSGETNGLVCPECKKNSEIHDYHFSPSWGFSDLGFTFWNWPEFKEKFISEFEEKLGHEVDIVYAHI